MVKHDMEQDLGIARILSLLGVPGREQSGEDGSDPISSDVARREPRYELKSGALNTSISRTEARILLFLDDPIREWLAGGDPAGAESNLRWSIVKGAEEDLLEIRIGDREPMRFDRSTTSAALASVSELRTFAQTRD